MESLVEYRVLIPLFIDPATSFKYAKSPLREKLISSLQKHLIETAFLEMAAIKAGAKSPDEQISIYLGPAARSLFSEEMFEKICEVVEENIFLTEGSSDQSYKELHLEWLSNVKGNGILLSKETTRVFQLLKESKLIGDLPFSVPELPPNKKSYLEQISEQIKNHSDPNPLLTGKIAWYEEFIKSFENETTNSIQIYVHHAIRIPKRVFLVNMFRWGQLFSMLKENWQVDWFVGVNPVLGRYYVKEVDYKATNQVWDLSIELIFFADKSDRRIYPWLSKQAHEEFIQNGIYFTRNGLPFMIEQKSSGTGKR